MTGVVASALTPHSKRTSVPRLTFILCGLLTMTVGSEVIKHDESHNQKAFVFICILYLKIFRIKEKGAPHL